MLDTATAPTKSPDASKGSLSAGERGNTATNVKPTAARVGLVLTGKIVSVDEAVNRSGLAKKAPHNPYSMNFRRFQVFADKVLYDCQDSRDDEKHPQTGAVLRLGVELFPGIEEGQSVSLRVKDVEVRNGEVSLWNVDTSGL